MAYETAYLFEEALPWTKTEYDRRFVGIASVAFVIGNIIFLILAFIAAFFNPTLSEEELKVDENRLVQLIIEQQQEKPKPPEPKKPEPKKPEPKKPEPKKPEPKKPEPKPEPVKQPVKDARKVASESGLLAMQDQLADLRQSFNKDIFKNTKPSSSSGAAAGPNVNNENTVAVIASRAGQGSGGINTGNLGKSTGGGSLAGRDTTSVKSTINSTGGGKGTGGGSASGKSRGQEEVELVFQQNKGAIFTIYNRFLRDNPSLKGKVVLEITIAPNGSVMDVRIVSSELNNPELEQKIAARVKLFKFEPRNNVDVTKVTYPIDFLPS